MLTTFCAKDTHKSEVDMTTFGYARVRPTDRPWPLRMQHSAVQVAPRSTARRLRGRKPTEQPRAWKPRHTSNVELRALPALQLSPPASIHPLLKPKKRALHSQRRPPTSPAPGDIIPECRATINRNSWAASSRNRWATCCGIRTHRPMILQPDNSGRDNSSVTIKRRPISVS